ncbi:cytochrome c oxidase subunit 3 [Pseudomonas sp. Marseille-Q5115]|uniref:cytochrome c oxidase subunit 3 n=1 Tax=Pseudomonas sp. Marseille-Q5115 TaxID=2866593 RepID=UPI001CE48AEE|nr:cytochrome c oxidase subunit 3 [Pseudomonas sp. Marseille-Q5115]
MAGIERAVTEQFVSEEQRREAVHQGMWLFLATETMMFGVLLFAATYFRLAHPAAIAEAVEHFHYLLAGVNSALLLTSSLTVTLALYAARAANRRSVQNWLLVASALAAAFLVLKGFEYHSEFEEKLLPGQADNPLQAPAAKMFVGLYLVITGVHALHVTVAILFALGIYWRLQVGRLRMPERYLLLETFALYWHVVDIIWIFVYPTLYLIGRPA